MIFRQMFHADTSTLTYLLADEASKMAVLIDPVVQDVPKYERLLQELGLTLQATLDTHVHADHVTAASALRDALGSKIMISKQSGVTCADVLFDDGDRIGIGLTSHIEILAMHTPGHTDDSYSFLVGNKLLTGDTLLIRGTGRTDFQNGDAGQMYRSIFDKLMALPGETQVYPGHDYNGMSRSTLAEERAHNPRLQVNTEQEFVGILDNLNLPYPRYIDLAVPANRICGAV